MSIATIIVNILMGKLNLPEEAFISRQIEIASNRTDTVFTNQISVLYPVTSIKLSISAMGHTAVIKM